MIGGGAELLDRVVIFVRRYVVLSKAQLAVVTLWIVHTNAFDAAEETPYLSITSAEKQCGKTRLLEVLQLLVRNPWFTARVSAAVLARKVEAQKPTLLLDESDAAFSGPGDYSEALRGLLNSGYKRGGCTTVCVGATHTPKDFQTFCPKAIAGIGKLPDTVADRSIPIRLQRKNSAEPTARFRRREVEPPAASLRKEIDEWSKQNLERLLAARPELPAILSDRQQDVAEPLLAIADLADGEWPQRSRKALIELLTGSSAEDDSVRVRLLADIRGVFEREPARNKIPSRELVSALLADETSPWLEFNKGKPLTEVTVARLLKPFEISPRTIKLDDDKTAKGYLRQTFEDTFNRYLPTLLRSEPSPPSPEVVYAGLTPICEPPPKASVTLPNGLFSPIKTGLVTLVTVQNVDAQKNDFGDTVLCTESQLPGG